MAEIATAGRGGPRARPRRRRRGDGGLHPPDPVRGRARGPAAGPARAGADPHDARRAVRPDARDGGRAQAGLLLRRQPGRRLAAPLPRRDRARLAAAGGARGAQPRRHGEPLRRRRVGHAVRADARLRGDRPARAHARGAGHVPVHRRAARRGAGAPPGRRDRPRAGGRPRRQRPAVGHPRRPEGGRAGGAAIARDRRADRRGARAAAGRRRDPGLGDRCRRGGPGGAQPSYAHGVTRRDNDFYRAWDAISRDRDRFTAWMGEHVL